MKPHWTKVYSGPGYPIDPVKQAERASIEFQEFVSCMNDVITKTVSEVEKAMFVGDDPSVPGDEKMIHVSNSHDPNSFSVVDPFDPQESLDHIVESFAQEQCEAMKGPSIYFEDDFYETRHVRRLQMIRTESFQSRLMAIEVKDRTKSY